MRRALGFAESLGVWRSCTPRGGDGEYPGVGGCTLAVVSAMSMSGVVSFFAVCDW